MPDLGWDITEQLEVQEVNKTDTSVPILPETVIAIIILIVTILISMKAHITKISKEITQAILNTTRAISQKGSASNN